MSRHNKSLLLFISALFFIQFIFLPSCYANVWVLSLPKTGAGAEGGASTSPAPAPSPQAPRITSGSAFFINDNGLLVTNYHVVANSIYQAVVDPQSKTSQLVPAKIISADPVNDLAILQANIRSKAIPLATTTPKRGEEVLTLGYPNLDVQGFQQKATFGRINSMTGLYDDKRFMQVDLPIQPGNSGGPLLNSKGEVIGIVTARMTGNFQNVNYALKVTYLHELLKKANIKIPPRKNPTATMPMDQIIDQFQSSVVIIFSAY